MCDNDCMVKKLIDIIKPIIKLIISSYCFYLAWKFAWLRCEGQSIAFLTTGFLFVFILFSKEIVQVFENISVFGLNVKLREVKNLVVDLTNLLKATAGLELESILQPITNEKLTYESMEIKYKKITELLKKYNIESKIIESIQEKHWHEKIYRIYTKKIFETISLINKKKEYYDKWHNEYEPFVAPEEIKVLLTEIQDINDGIKKIILDYEYYYKNKRHRSIPDWNLLLKSGFENGYLPNATIEE